MRPAATIVAFTVLFTASAVDEADARTDYRLTNTYATCYSLHGTMADGSGVRLRSAASNVLRLGTKIRLVGRPFYRGLRRFVVRDTGGALWDGHVDIWWYNYSDCLAWGRRPINYKIGWGRP